MTGTVAALRRYPVKSMQGEEVEETPVGERGLLGDRAWAVVEADTGRVASAKHPRRWERLLACRAAYVEPPRPGAPLPPVRIRLPDGAEVGSDDPAVHRVLSELLGREVRLAASPPAGALRETDRSPLDGPGGERVQAEPLALAAPAGTFFDVAPLHLLTTATLERLARLAPGTRFDPARFRPNVLVAGAGDGAELPEIGWIGRELALGPEVRAAVIDPTPRCVVTTLPQGALPRDPAVLRTVVRSSSAASATLAPGVVFAGVAGVYAQVRRGGLLRVGAALAPAALTRLA